MRERFSIVVAIHVDPLRRGFSVSLRSNSVEEPRRDVWGLRLLRDLRVIHFVTCEQVRWRRSPHGKVGRVKIKLDSDDSHCVQPLVWGFKSITAW